MPLFCFDVVFLFWYSGISRVLTIPYLFYFRSDFYWLLFLELLHRQTLPCLFSKRFYWLLLWVTVGGIFPSTNLFLLILVSSNFCWLNSKIFGNYFSIKLRMENMYTGGLFEKKKRRKKGRKEVKRRARSVKS